MAALHRDAGGGAEITHRLGPGLVGRDHDRGAHKPALVPGDPSPHARPNPSRKLPDSRGLVRHLLCHCPHVVGRALRPGHRPPSLQIHEEPSWHWRQGPHRARPLHLVPRHRQCSAGRAEAEGRGLQDKPGPPR